MNASRLAIVLFWAAWLPLIGGPAGGPWLACVGQSYQWPAVTLLANSVGLTLLVLAVAVPLGVRAAGRRYWAAALFVPLPVVAAAWFGVIPIVPTRWTAAFLTAAWVHAIAAVPWVAWLTGHALAGVERELIDDARTAAPPGIVRRMALRRVRPVVAFAAVVVAWQVLTEMTVTDVAQVRTWAEDVYTQLILSGEADVAVRSAMAAAVLPMAAFGGIAAAVALWSARTCPPLLGEAARRADRDGWMWPLAWLAVPAVTLVVAASRAPAWPGLQLSLIATTFLTAFAAGILTTAFALFGVVACCESAVASVALFSAAVVVAMTPGPVVGFGLKSWIDRVMETDATGLAASWLYDGPSPLPALWATIIRAWPIAVAVLWPVARARPTALIDAVRADGGTAWLRFRLLTWPTVRPAIGPTVLLTAAFALGEVAASKLVATPGWCGGTFAHFVFTRLHYGLTPDLAATCIVVVAIVIIGAIIGNR